MINLTEIYKTLIEENGSNPYHDRPRATVVDHPDYDDVVSKVSGMSNPVRIKKYIEDWILSNESDFADKIFSKKYECYINCEHAAEMVGQILDDANIPYKLQVGVIRGQSHAWVKMGDVIIDPTVSQFNPPPTYDEYQDAVNGEGGWSS